MLDRRAGRTPHEGASHAVMAGHHRAHRRSLESAVAMAGLLLRGERGRGQKERAGQDGGLEPG